MELRVLQYYLAVTREQSISGAAESLHLSQPTLSRQLKDMEEELGKQLFIRSNRRITLTEEGMILRKRAEEILDLVGKTEREIAASDDVIEGDVYIGAAETDIVRLFGKAAQELQTQYPNIHYHISSGNIEFVLEQLDKGLIDLGLIYGPVDPQKYESREIPLQDTWGVLMRTDSPLAQKQTITPEDLWDKPLILSRQADPEVKWLKKDIAKLNVVATYNLVYNASLLVDEGLGYALSFDKLIYTDGNCSLCFRPLSPKLESTATLVWKRYQVFSRAASRFLLKMQEIVQ
ncbi:LysR family transcriptional regulator [Qiania dongpingensis]|uniref:LysR family transcriptional regulator n=1 Tax=Qiania dongpingensis TaxID=2763669 RepID=A0A7G9G3C2_9FIRM|nr:LysR family transcriptional regulator [Qiania dongpingensis]QNM05304.1 LysR family transcriptional regulator [Qiania dongpingensis]